MNIAMRTKIRTLREGKGISQSQMAEKLHMDERNYKRIENGEKKTMDTDLLYRLADILEVDATDLLVNENIYIENNDIHDNPNSTNAAYQAEATTNNFPPELKNTFEDMMQLMRKLIEEQSETIKLLREIKDK